MLTDALLACIWPWVLLLLPLYRAQIIKGEIPSCKVAEGPTWIAFLDINPRRPGHTLVVPKEEKQRLKDLSVVSRADLLDGVAEVERRLSVVFGTTDFQVNTHDGPMAGQEVPHVHIHVIPRSDGDGGQSMLAMWPKAPAIGSVQPDFGALGDLSKKLLAVPPAPPPGFIDSPFKTKTEYEAFTKLPAAEQPAALRAAATPEKRIRRALLSVSDKAGLTDLAQALHAHGVELLSTGGTAKAIRAAGLPCKDVSEFTGSPEIMDGRVKTLHPRVHGGILARELEGFDDPAQLAAIGGAPIDLVVVNLYPFKATVAKGAPYAECIENIDIGGPTMVRAAAKNHERVSIVVNASDYSTIINSLPVGPSLEARKLLALKAYSHTATYDTMIAEWLQGELLTGKEGVTTLKYGCNPQQKPASVRGLLSPQGPMPMPFDVLSGTPGYINLLDALNAWQLVKELSQATNLPAAASFKHVSPAGAAVYAPLDDEMLAVYEATGKQLSQTAIAYVRARQADPLCSFGDFIAISGVVDMSTANLIKIEVSDGIIAGGFEPGALEILKAKKGGKYIVLQADPSYEPPLEEERVVFGTTFRQTRAAEHISGSTLDNVVTADKNLTPEARRDLLVAQIAIKYTQSNSVGYAKDGQMVGVGAGQQSRVDCVKLAGRKVETWYLRQHPKVRALKFKASVKRQERINGRVRYIEGDMPPTEFEMWKQMFDTVPEMLTQSEKAEFLKGLTGVSLASDAFFPFRDSIDVASTRGVSYVVAAGGSVGDEEVIAAANQYKMIMAFSGLRLFHH